MLKSVRICAAAAVLLGFIGAPATAQFPPGPDDQSDQTPGAAKGKKAAAPAAAGGPNIAGSWSGQLTQVGSQTPYKVELTINA
ncbi:MAG: hypothetical protein ACJ8ER_03130, partial [Allosphingosinicella sp.]